jgi:hypothetical protein
MSTIRPRKRLIHGGILIAAAAIVAFALVPAAGAGAPQGHHLEFRLSGPSPQNVVGAGAIQINARCPVEACTVVASAASKNPAIRTGTTRAKIRAGAAEPILLLLRPHQQAKLRSVVKSGRKPTFTVHAAAHDSAGTRIPLKIMIETRKP